MSSLVLLRQGSHQTGFHGSAVCFVLKDAARLLVPLNCLNHANQAISHQIDFARPRAELAATRSTDFDVVSGAVAFRFVPPP